MECWMVFTAVWFVSLDSNHRCIRSCIGFTYYSTWNLLLLNLSSLLRMFVIGDQSCWYGIAAWISRTIMVCCLSRDRDVDLESWQRLLVRSQWYSLTQRKRRRYLHRPTICCGLVKRSIFWNDWLLQFCSASIGDAVFWQRASNIPLLPGMYLRQDDLVGMRAQLPRLLLCTQSHMQDLRCALAEGLSICSVNYSWQDVCGHVYVGWLHH